MTNSDGNGKRQEDRNRFSCRWFAAAAITKSANTALFDVPTRKVCLTANYCTLAKLKSLIFKQLPSGSHLAISVHAFVKQAEPNGAAHKERQTMRNSTRLVRAFVAAAMLSSVMVFGTPVHAADSGMSSSNTFVCAFAEGVILRVPAGARQILKNVFEGITSCTNLTVAP